MELSQSVEEVVTPVHSSNQNASIPQPTVQQDQPSANQNAAGDANPVSYAQATKTLQNSCKTHAKRKELNRDGKNTYFHKVLCGWGSKLTCSTAC